LERLADPSCEVLWSAVATSEIAGLVRLGRIALSEPLSRIVSRELRKNGFTSLALEHSHAAKVAELPLHHRDPFDRLLVAQAMVEEASILSLDRTLDLYDVERVE
jgi:PIN domain nuclease of toxin-antitoxin system